MAQQIQFIYLTQSEYDSLASKNIGRIYFTSDTHRIYKGSDLYAATTFDQLNFSAIQASSITVDGSAVSLEGHGHSVADIDGLESAITAATSGFASESHTHVIGDIQSLTAKVNGLTSNKVSKTNAEFTNLSASTATFETLVVTGEVTMSLSSVDFQSINASSLTVNGNAVSLEGHSHSASEISGLDAAISAATSNFATSGHTHNISDITSLATKVSGLTSNKVEKTNGVFTNLSATNLVVSSAAIDAISIEASSMTVNGTGTFNTVSASTATFGDINVTGTASLSATHVSASTLTADSGTFTNLTVVSAFFDATSIEASAIATSSITVGGSAVALVGHTHPASEVTGLQSVLDGLSSTYALASHSHAISDITNLSTVLTGITSSSVEKDTVTADIGYFRLLSVSGSANFAVNTVSANAVTVNGTEVALSGHTHSVADIDGLSTALGGFASSGHTHGELTGITQTSISKANANFTTVSASSGTFNTLTTTDLNFTNLSISSASVSSMTVANLNVTNTLKLNNKDIATQEYV